MANDDYACSEQCHYGCQVETHGDERDQTHWHGSGLKKGQEDVCDVEVYVSVQCLKKQKHQDMAKIKQAVCDCVLHSSVLLLLFTFGHYLHMVFFFILTPQTKTQRFEVREKNNTIYYLKCFCIVHMLSVGLP